MEWNSHQEEEYIDILALSDKPRKEPSSGYDVIIVTRTLFPKDVGRPEKAMIFLASMCRLQNPAAVYANEPPSIEQDKEKTLKTFPLTCVVQKAQSKTGVFNLEEIYGLETLTNKTKDDEKKGEGSDDGSTTGDCVICLSDPRYCTTC